MNKIPEIRLVLNPQTEEAKSGLGFKWNRAAGRNHKLGGEPDWIQDDETPPCSCGKDMTFYGQFDAIGDDYCLGDLGMIYVFACFDCLETKSIFQCG